MSRTASWKSALGTAALLSTLAAALPASAQIIIQPICFAPDLATCQKPGYLESSCGQKFVSTCKPLLQNEYNRQYNLLTRSRDTLVPPNLSGAGGVTTARLDPVNWAGYYATGLTSTVEGEVLRTQAATLRNFGTMFAIDPRFRWKEDGARVKSCEELTYERYNSFGVFEDQALGMVDSPWNLFFDAYYATNAIAFQDLRDSTGGSIGPLTFPPGPSPKNPFFEPLPREYPPGQTPYSFSSTTLATIEAGRAWHTWSWQRHLDLGWQFGGLYYESQLKEGYELGRNHALAIAERRRIWEEYLRAADACRGNSICLSNANSQYGSLLYAQDQLLAFDFYIGQQAGCFTTATSICDWSPQLFWEQVRERVHRVRDADFQLCKRLTRNDFRGGVVQQAVTYGIPDAGIPAYDWPSTPQRFMLFLALLNSYLENLDLPKDPLTGKPVLGRFVGDTVNKGNDWFGLQFTYEAGWGVTGMEGAGKVCNAQLQARASFNATAKVLTYSVNVLDSLAWLSTETPDPVNAPNQTVLYPHAHLTVLGSSIYDSGWGSSPLDFSIATNRSKQLGQYKAGEVYIPVLGVPVKVAGGLSGVVGLDANLSGYMQRNCNVNTVGFAARGLVKPYAQVDGWLTASFNAAIIEAGVYGRLTLVRADLPLSLQVSTLGPDGARALSAGTRLDLVLRTLDGRLGVFGRVLTSTYEKDLIRWQGPEHRSNLFEFTLDPPVSLAAVDVLL